MLQFLVAVFIIFVVYQYWKKQQEAPRVRKQKKKGDVIDITAARGEDLEKGELPYKKRPYLQDRSQRLMFEGLKQHLAGYAVEVYPQVDMLKLVYVPASAKNFMGYMNRMAGKTADFVVCDAQTLEPVVVICLDKMGENFTRQHETNLFIDRAFAKAGLPLVRFMASEDAYSWEEVMAAVQPHLTGHLQH